MPIRFCVVFLCMLSLFACSSSRKRAPVSDLTLGSNSSYTASIKKGRISGKNYTVQKGDTLYSIGWRSGISINELIQRNHINKPYIIKAGQRLQLTDNKTHYVKKASHKSDLSSQNSTKNSNSACTAQNCQKNKEKKLDQKKTKAYSSFSNDIKIANKNNQLIKSNKKVNDWSWPVKGKVTKLFSASPSGKQGISIVNVQGSYIRATASGEVVYAGNGLRGYGNLIIIKHNYDYLSAYAHNEKLLVREKEKIKKGQKIATMGDSGSDHVHLHFEIRYRGKSVDPLRYLPKR